MWPLFWETLTALCAPGWQGHVTVRLLQEAAAPLAALPHPRRPTLSACLLFHKALIHTRKSHPLLLEGQCHIFLFSN